MAADAERIRELEEKLARVIHERDEYRKLYELVLMELERVRRHLRAQNKSERVDPAQIQLAFSEVAGLILPPEMAAQIAEQENARTEDDKGGQQGGQPGGRRPPRTKPHGRAKLPEHLPVERIELDPPESLRTCACCGRDKERIGEETSERLDWRPASLVRVLTARGKYACSCEQDGVVIAEVPDSPVDKGLAGPGLLAHIAVSKYEDHLPLNRLEGIFARLGVHLSRSTMADWIAQVADLLRPITDAMAKAALGAHRIHVDDTPLPVRGPDKKTHKGFMWVYIADDDHVLFRYSSRRNGEAARSFFTDYKGFIQADAASLYDRLFGDDDATEVGCWAHARRRFCAAHDTDTPRAHRGRGYITTMSAAARLVRKLPPSLRTQERRNRAGPVLEAFKQWLDAQQLVVLPKTPIADAIGYVRNQWGALTRFLDDARLELDNNAAERSLRRVAVGRKNWMFAGSERGAERAAVLWTLLASCKLHQVDPFAYLRDVLTRVSSHPARDVLALSPKAWKQQLQDAQAQ